MKNLNATQMVLWGLAIYGGYSLLKTQTTWLNQSGGFSSTQAWGSGGVGGVGRMGCRGLTNRLRAKHRRLQSLGNRQPRRRARIQAQIRQIETWMRERGCRIPII